MFPSCAFLMQCCTLQEMEYGEKACATCGRPTSSLVSHGRTGWLRWWCSSREWPVCLWWEAPMSPTTVWAWGLGKPSKPCSCLVPPQTTGTGWSCQSTASTGLCRWPPFPRLESPHHPSLWPLHTFPRLESRNSLLTTHLWLDSLPQHLWLDSLPPPHLWLERLLPQPNLQLWSHRRRSTKEMAHNMRKVPEHISMFFIIAFACFNFWKNHAYQRVHVSMTISPAMCRWRSHLNTWSCKWSCFREPPSWCPNWSSWRLHLLQGVLNSKAHFGLDRYFFSLEFCWAGQPLFCNKPQHGKQFFSLWGHGWKGPTWSWMACEEIPNYKEHMWENAWYGLDSKAGTARCFVQCPLE